MSKIYVTGSMRSDRVLEAHRALVAAGHLAFCDWCMPGPNADLEWKRRSQLLGLSYADALRGPHARNVFDFDYRWLKWAEGALMVMPCGASAWGEMGWLRGQGKPVVVWLEPQDPERWDIMLRFASDWTAELPSVLRRLDVALGRALQLAPPIDQPTWEVEP